MGLFRFGPGLDQALAAEPGFDSAPPEGGALRLIGVGHFREFVPVFAQEQPQNLFALAARELERQLRIMEAFAGSLSAEGACRFMIKAMNGGFEVGAQKRV